VPIIRNVAVRYVGGKFKEIDRGMSHARDKVKVNYIIGLLDGLKTGQVWR
jgi:hypothetical protein